MAFDNLNYNLTVACYLIRSSTSTGQRYKLARLKVSIYQSGSDVNVANAASKP